MDSGPKKQLIMRHLCTVVAKYIRTLVFSPAKKMVLSPLFLSFAVVVCQ